MTNPRTKSRRWQALFCDWVGNSRYGIRLVGVRRRGRGKWLQPGEVPQEVREYLLLAQTPGGLWYCTDFHSTKSLMGACTACVKRNDGLSVNFTVDEPVLIVQVPCNGLVRKLAAELGASSLYEIYRRVYKASVCGVGIGFAVRCNGEVTWKYCDSLREFGQLRAMFDGGLEILACSVSGYVEGWDGECDTHIIESVRGKSAKPADFWKAVEAAEAEAAEIWNDTHGCDDCGPENDYGYRSINPACKSCGGEGTIF